MSAKNYAASLSLLLAHEGGYSNNPKDPGGPTNKGVTQAVYDRHRKAIGQPAQSVKLITDAEVSTIYNDDYWAMVSADKLPDGVDYCIFDMAVNSGIDESIRILQRTINDKSNYYGVSKTLIVDGVIGQTTIDAVTMASAHGIDDLIEGYCDRRIAFMKTLKQWKTFGTGWTRRVEGAHGGAQDDDDGVVDIAIKMANATVAAPIIVANVAKPELTAALVAATPAATVIAPPSPVGARAGEEAGKAFPGQVALLRTVQGAGAALAAAGVTGNTALDAAGTVKTHINGTLMGQISLIAFALCMIAGVGLILFKFFEQQAEKRIG